MPQRSEQKRYERRTNGERERNGGGRDAGGGERERNKAMEAARRPFPELSFVSLSEFVVLGRGYLDCGALMHHSLFVLLRHCRVFVLLVVLFLGTCQVSAYHSARSRLVGHW